MSVKDELKFLQLALEEEGDALDTSELITDEMYDVLMHYGMPRRSGRYPWGSGEDPYQHEDSFLSRIEDAKKRGFTETPENIRKYFNMSTTEFRAERAIAVSDQRRYNIATAKSLAKDGLSPTEIGRKMGGIRESTVRSWLSSDENNKKTQARATADRIKEAVDSKGPCDVGVGVERELGVSKEKLNQALKLLGEEGYVVMSANVPNATSLSGKSKIINTENGPQVMMYAGKQITTKVIMPPGSDKKDFYKFKSGEMSVSTLTDYTSKDGGKTFEKFEYPSSLDSKRLKIKYAEDGGTEKDGIIELRRGVKDLSLGEDKYSQVRILVDDKYYLKGMAVYSDNLPDGVDVLFNSNKPKAKGMENALKKIKSDPDNPFGSTISAAGQYHYEDENGNKQLGLINKRAAQGDWSEWSDRLPAQFLSKQSKELAKKQLTLALQDSLDEFDEIKNLTNPTVKKYYLDKFAESCDSAAVHLQAAALPGQKYHVIIPINSMKENEVFAPRYEDGTKLALVRYPHEGTFQIPILTVNNRNRTAKQVIGMDSEDAVGINKSVAAILSGADFDGDTVMCIPTHDAQGKVRISNRDPLPGLRNYEPKDSYAYARKEVDPVTGEARYWNKDGVEFKRMRNTQTEMGIISNLITDMTLKGASESELERAVRHSMCVIDAEKHELDYKQCYIDNDIASLKKKYQPVDPLTGRGGASTLISRSKGELSVDRRKGEARINDPNKPDYDPTRPAGSLIWQTDPDATYSYDKIDPKTGEVTTVTKTRQQKSTRMAETDDARTLLSEKGTQMERLYADYANKQKQLANKARLEMINTPKLEKNKEAAEVYADVVKDLDERLNTALMNAPRERAAQFRANVEVNKKLLANPDMKPSDVKKAAQQELVRQRNALAAESRRERNIKITDRDWEAIQAGAISENKLWQILNNTDADSLRDRAMPKNNGKISTAKKNRIKAMANSNFTLAQIAQKLGVSVSTVSEVLNGGE